MLSMKHLTLGVSLMVGKCTSLLFCTFQERALQGKGPDTDTGETKEGQMSEKSDLSQMDFLVAAEQLLHKSLGFFLG